MKKTKASSLKIIKKFNNTLVPNFFYFTKKEFLNNKKFYINKIKRKFKTEIIIRSSALNEDNNRQSNAGKYDSFIVKIKNFNKIEDFIIKLIEKFKSQGDQILVQKFILNPEISGVIFTKDKTSNSHYYDISYDYSKKSHLVTSGKKNPTIKSLIIFKGSKSIPEKFKKIIKIISNLEKIFDNDRLDLEFCIKNNKVYILQCRPLLGSKRLVNKIKLTDVITNLEKKFEKINVSNQTLFGNKTVMSNMSDWNPAEMIGKKPSQLSLSLYSELITNSVWSEQRKNYGYKNVYPNKLMLNFAGSPYIDLRVDLNSFLPNDLNKKISEKLVNFSIKKITRYPELHDKIEFEVINTCFDFSIKDRNDLPLSVSEKKQYIQSLKNLTNKILDPKNKTLNKEIEKIELLKKKIDDIAKSKLSHIQKIYYLVNDCKLLGTLPFAGIARCAFISKAILDSLKIKKIINNNDIEKFYLGINTISKEINNEYFKSYKNRSFKKFVKKYGHVRPSTYSILTKNYSENYKNYFSKTIPKIKFKKINFSFNSNKIKEINKIFKSNKLKFSFEEFLKFARISMEKREYAKLIFTKSIDEIFKNLKNLSEVIKVDFKKFEHLDIDLILKSFHSLEQEKLRKIIVRNVSSNEKSYKFSQGILSPDVIRNYKDFSFFYNINNKENYITQKSITSEIIDFKKLKNFTNVTGKVVLIENADPGFDFLFSYKIKGLITKYGGSNSHMSIRCMELGLPAIIGVGEKIYKDFLKSKKIYIDCNNKKYSIIH